MLPANRHVLSILVPSRPAHPLQSRLCTHTCCLSPYTSSTAALPRFDVMMMMVFLNDTTRPWLSVTRPSSRIYAHTHTHKVVAIAMMAAAAAKQHTSVTVRTHACVHTLSTNPIPHTKHCQALPSGPAPIHIQTHFTDASKTHALMHTHAPHSPLLPAAAR